MTQADSQITEIRTLESSSASSPSCSQNTSPTLSPRPSWLSRSAEEGSRHIYTTGTTEGVASQVISTPCQIITFGSSLRRALGIADPTSGPCPSWLSRRKRVSSHTSTPTASVVQLKQPLGAHRPGRRGRRVWRRPCQRAQCPPECGGCRPS